MVVKAYLEIPDGHCSINAGGAEFTTISFVYLINRHLAENRVIAVTQTPIPESQKAGKFGLNSTPTLSKGDMSIAELMLDFWYDASEK